MRRKALLACGIGASLLYGYQLWRIAPALPLLRRRSAADTEGESREGTTTNVPTTAAAA
jgi:hypothetical protein